MIRKRDKRAARGKRTAFRIKGKPIAGKRLSRYIRRNGSALPGAAQDQAELGSPRTLTSPDSAIGSPRAEALPAGSSPEPGTRV